MATAGDEHVRTFVDEALRRGEADAAVAAGNHCYFSVQFAHGFLLSSVSGIVYRTVWMRVKRGRVHLITAKT